MFSLFGKRDGFEERAKRQQVWKVLRRVINTRAPVDQPDECSDRNFNRYNRCVPVAIIDAENIDPAQAVFAPTKDFSDNGLSFITNSAVEFEEVVCVIREQNPVILSGNVRRSRPFGGELKEIGVEFTEVIESGAIRELLQPVMDALNVQMACKG